MNVTEVGTRHGTTALRSARMLDVIDGGYREDVVITVEDGRIKTIQSGVLAVESDAIDLGDRVILPGLMDCHTHIFLQGNRGAVAYQYQILEEHRAHRVARATRSLRIALSHGFTMLRDLGTEGCGYDDVSLRDAVAQGVLEGPRLQVAGPALTSTGSYPIIGYRPDWSFPCGVGVADGPDACRRAVREQLSFGVDWIKIYANAGAGGWETEDGYIGSAPNWTAAEYRAMVDEAHKRGVRVASHATSDVGVQMAIDAGTDTIEHGYSIRPDIARLMAKQGVFLSPLLLPTHYSAEVRGRELGSVWLRAPEIQARSFRNCLDAGVKIAFGTDQGSAPWTDVNEAQEFAFLTRAGMSPLEAMRSATVTSAELLGVRQDAGCMSVGRWADIVGLRGDPLSDIAALEGVDFVMKAGEVRRMPVAA
ncbi:MAG: amidohydrolase family protein [Candidatus Limnocylindrales bacterium]